MFMLLGCTSKQAEIQAILVQSNAPHANKTILSYVRAYLLIGNIKKAREQFQKIKQAELHPGAMLALAELRAAEGDIIGAQQAFVLSFADNQLNTPLQIADVSPGLIDFFCLEKKWPAIEAYGAALIRNIPVIGSINSSLSKVGSCFFNAQQWPEAKYWLEQVDFAKPVEPFVYPALAQISIEEKQYLRAKTWMEKFESTKTTLDAKTLWTAFEVYRALQKPDRALGMAQHLRSQFPNSAYGRKHLRLVKSGQIEPLEPMARAKAVQKTSTPAFHLIKRGETLFQLSKQYDLTLADLLLWNPDLVIENIAVGTQIRISPPN
jgi:Tfp pilus assembly protein PilF